MINREMRRAPTIPIVQIMSFPPQILILRFSVFIFSKRVSALFQDDKVGRILLPSHFAEKIKGYVSTQNLAMWAAIKFSLLKFLKRLDRYQQVGV